MDRHTKRMSDNEQRRDGRRYSTTYIRGMENPEYAAAAEEYRKQHEARRRIESQEALRSRRHENRANTYNEAKHYPEYQEDLESANKRVKKKRKKKKPIKKLITIIVVILALLFAALCGYICYITSHLDKVDTTKEEMAINEGVASDLRGYRNIAILGIDARANETIEGSRTDAIIIMSIKKLTGDIKIMSLMRDSYLKMEYTDGSLILDKITHAHHYKGGNDTIAALNRSLDLNIKEYVIFGWKSVADTVDALGGIDVTIKSNEIGDLNKWGPETGDNVGRAYTKITETGKQTIDGVQAATYCRIRKNSGGDPGRGERYKKVLTAVMKKVLSSPSKANTLAKEVLPEIRTNMNQAQILSAILAAPTYDIVKSYSWPKTYWGGILPNGVWYAIPQSLESNVSWMHKVLFGDNDYEPTQTVKDISYEIQNKTGY